MKKALSIKTPFISVVLAVFCTLLWGTAFPFIKLGYSAFEIAEGDIGSKLLFAGFRFTLAGLMVIVFLFISRRRVVLPKNSDILPIISLAIIMTAGQYIFTYIGIGFTSGTNTSIITACASFFTVLFAPIFFKSDRLTVFKVLGCILGFAGVVVINGIGGFSLDTIFGDVLILCSTLCSTAGNFLSKKISGGRNPVMITGYQLFVGGLVLCVAGYLCGGRLSFSNPECLWILLWLAFVSAAAFTVWTALLKHHPASKISVFNLLVPIFGTVLSGVLLGEDVFNIETLVSLVLISLGITAVNLNIDSKKLKSSHKEKR